MDFVELGKKIGVEGFLHPSELARLVELAANRDVLEVGSFKGLSAWGMGITAKSVTCVDTFSANSAGQAQMNEMTTFDDFTAATRRYDHVTIHVATSAEAAPRLSNKIFDLIFLDAMHTFEDVRDDIERWWPILKVGGLFVFHDYRHADFPGVEKAVDERFGPAPEGTTVVTLRWITKT